MRTFHTFRTKSRHNLPILSHPFEDLMADLQKSRRDLGKNLPEDENLSHLSNETSRSFHTFRRISCRRFTDLMPTFSRISKKAPIRWDSQLAHILQSRKCQDCRIATILSPSSSQSSQSCISGLRGLYRRLCVEQSAQILPHPSRS